MSKKVMLSCVITVSCVAYSAQELAERARPERKAVLSAQDLVDQSSGRLGLAEDGAAVYLTVTGLLDFQQEMQESIAGDLIQEHEKEIKAQEELNQARLEALKERLAAEGKSEQEIGAQLKREQDAFDAEIEELIKQHAQAQHAKVTEFLSQGIGVGLDQDWDSSPRFVSGIARAENHEFLDAATGSDRASEIGSESGQEDWDSQGPEDFNRLCLSSSIIAQKQSNSPTKQWGDL